MLLKATLGFESTGVQGLKSSKFFCKHVLKARACKKFSLTLNPRKQPKGNCKPHARNTDFFRLGLGKKCACMRYGARVSEPPKTLFSLVYVLYAFKQRLIRDRRTICQISHLSLLKNGDPLIKQRVARDEICE